MKIFAVFIAVFLIIFLGDAVDAYNQAFITAHGASELNIDIFYKMFGGFKNFLSDVSYVEADIYYHGGIYDFTKHEEHLHVACMDEKNQKSTRVSAVHKHLKKQVKPSLNILLDIAKALQITEHRHITGNEKKEVIPWFYYAVKLNPHNEPAYAVGGFWLAVKLKKPDEAIKFLREGLKNNPCSWELWATLGQVYFINKKDYENAKISLEKAKEFGDKESADKYDKRRIYGFLAGAYEKMGRNDKAVKLYEEILNLFPGDKAIEKKLNRFSFLSLS